MNRLSKVLKQFAFGLMLIALPCSGVSFAQGPGMPPPEGFGPDGPPPPPFGMQRKPDPKRMEELRKKIQETKYEKLRQQLAMDDATAAKFFEIYKPAEKDIQEIAKQRNEELGKLNRMMNGDKTDADVDPEVAKVRELSHKIEDRQMQLDQDLKPVLSPRQRARLLVFEHEFNKRVHEQIAKHRFMDNHPGLKNPALRQQLKELRKERRMK